MRRRAHPTSSARTTDALCLRADAHALRRACLADPPYPLARHLRADASKRSATLAGRDLADGRGETAGSTATEIRRRAREHGGARPRAAEPYVADRATTTQRFEETTASLARRRSSTSSNGNLRRPGGAMFPRPAVRAPDKTPGRAPGRRPGRSLRALAIKAGARLERALRRARRQECLTEEIESARRPRGGGFLFFWFDWAPCLLICRERGREWGKGKRALFSFCGFSDAVGLGGPDGRDAVT